MGKKEDALELIAAKKLVVYSKWLDLNNLGLVLLGLSLEIAAAWFAFRYEAGGIAGRVAISGLACQVLSIAGWYGSPKEISNGNTEGGVKTLLFMVHLPSARPPSLPPPICPSLPPSPLSIPASVAVFILSSLPCGCIT